MGTFQKILTTGLGAALMTENTIRSALTESQLTQQAKDYLMRVLAAELKKFLSKIDLHQEIQRALEGLTVDVEAKIKISGSPKKSRHHFTYRAKAIKGK